MSSRQGTPAERQKRERFRFAILYTKRERGKKEEEVPQEKAKCFLFFFEWSFAWKRKKTENTNALRNAIQGAQNTQRSTRMAVDLQQPSQLRVPVRNVQGFAVRELVDDVSEQCQRQIDLLGLFQSLSIRTSL